MTPEFAGDFIAFQKSLKPLKRNAVGDDGKPFADLPSIIAYVRPRLARYRMGFMQAEDTHDVVTAIVHASGYCHSWAAKPSVDSDGTLRYGRRHALMCLLGLVEEPLPPAEPELDRADLLIDAYGSRTIDVAEAFHKYRIGRGQQIVIVRRCPNADEAIAEAQRLGGGK